VIVLDIILGRRLANRESGERKIGTFEAVPAMGLDALGSSSYGPEAALAVLAPLGAASLGAIEWVTAPIIALALILLASYWQTLIAYPNNGGAYIVAKENLGVHASLLAAAALMIDYVLNVAVGISAGIGALVSAVPPLYPYTLPLCLGVLAVITLANLRGTADAGRLFALPAYAFIASFVLILTIGIGKIVLGGHPDPVVRPPPLREATQTLSFWLLLRAFAAGCTAMTGVEAVSNGMSAFREPRIVHGHRTLATIVIILGLLLAGISFLAVHYGIGAMDQTKSGYRSVLSQLAAAVAGEGPLFYIAMTSLLCVLALSANTSFVAFPRMCRLVAQDGFLPCSFAIAGRRLVFSAGILYLAGAAGILLFVFDGITDRLIPLFAVGAFLTFTLSQIGMVVHWSRTGDRANAARLHLSINALGAFATALALIVIVGAKFLEGAWITVVIIPCVIALLKSIRSYYDSLAERLKRSAPMRASTSKPPIVLVATEDWNELTSKALTFAVSLSPDVIAFHVTELSGPEGEEHGRSLRRHWGTAVEDPAREGDLPVPRLIILNGQYRTIHEPVLKLVRELEEKFPGRRVAILVPEVVKQHWYQNLLHAHNARHLRRQLLRHGGPRLTMISMPWYLDEAYASNPAGSGEAPGERGTGGSADVNWSRIVSPRSRADVDEDHGLDRERHE
jgi:amino acid transporter